MLTAIYALSELGGSVRYVGKTTKPLQERLTQHLAEARKLRKNHRLNWLRSVGDRVEIFLIDLVVGDGAAEEICLIAALRKLGARLVNGTSGGDGTLGVVRSAETRARMSLAQLGKKATPFTKLKQSLAHKGKKFTEEHREHLSMALRGKQLGRVLTEDHRRKIAKANAGKAHSSATRKKISASKVKITALDVSYLLELRAQGATFDRIAALTGFSASQCGNRVRGIFRYSAKKGDP